MEKYPDLTIEYFEFIENFFGRYKIDKRVFFKGVLSRWDIKPNDSPSVIKNKLQNFYRILSHRPDHFIDYAITWCRTPNGCRYNWELVYDFFIDAYKQWKKIKNTET